MATDITVHPATKRATCTAGGPARSVAACERYGPYAEAPRSPRAIQAPPISPPSRPALSQACGRSSIASRLSREPERALNRVPVLEGPLHAVFGDVDPMVRGLGNVCG